MYQQEYLSLDNKYKRIYENLIETRRNMGRTFKNTSGFEKHHIIPKSPGGNNKSENLVLLTPREHCLAHMLLTKIYSGRAKAKMICALNSMIKARNKNRDPISSKEYHLMRSVYLAQVQSQEYRDYRSEITKNQWTPERRASVSYKRNSS